MPAERGKDAAERFAAAVDAGRSPLSAGSDADLARELEIVARLRSGEGALRSHDEAMAMLRSGTDAYSPSPDERARSKQRLMAMLAERGAPAAEAPVAGARVVEFPAVTAADPTSPIPVVRDEPAAPAGATDTGPADLADTADTADPADPADPADGDADEHLAPVTALAGRSRRGRHVLPAALKGEAMGRSADRGGLARRAGVVGSAALFVLIAFTGAGVFVSRDALPGQTLYPLKRAAEAAGLAMTFDESERAQRNLELAALRIGELEQLLALGGSSVDPQVVRVAMSEFDVATNEGSRGLRTGQDDTSLQAWAATQSARLSALRPSLPVPAVPAADDSIALLDGLIDGTVSDEGGSSSASGGEGSTPGRTGGSIPSERGGTTGAPEGDDPDATSESPTDEDTLPGLQPESGPLTAEPESPASTTPDAPADSTGSTSTPRVPLPLPGAPITLPPLLPGMPSLTIG